MLKKIILLLPLLLLVNLASLFSQDSKVTVVADEAHIYINANENSIKIDKVKKGTVLTLFDPWEGEKAWLYVTYRSEKWKAKVTGFIKSELVIRGEIKPQDIERKKAPTPEVEVAEKDKRKATGVEIELDKLPSLKDFMKAKKTEEAAEDKKGEIPEPVAKEPEAEKRIVEPEKSLPEIKEKTTPFVTTEFLGETVIAEARRIDPASG
ncbi:MAG: hypothetical protein JXB23_01640, partial [Candidatus Aminicenantes bacterium]|nr:hypothetical protein [Candidatus Aminicenantes bacterium]